MVGRNNLRVSDVLADAKTKPENGQLEDFLPYQLSIASNAVSALIAERYRKRFGIKIPEWRIMAVLGNRHETRIGVTQRELTEVTLMDKVAVNRACKVLEGRGLIERLPNAEDGRSHLLALTGEGRAIHLEVMPLALETESELLKDFDPGERVALRVMLERMRERAELMMREANL